MIHKNCSKSKLFAAFLTNRVGDYFLTIGMFAILWSFGNVDYTTVFSLSPFYSETLLFLLVYVY